MSASPDTLREFAGALRRAADLCEEAARFVERFDETGETAWANRARELITDAVVLLDLFDEIDKAIT